jgi:hypothetical protein
LIQYLCLFASTSVLRILHLLGANASFHIATKHRAFCMERCVFFRPLSIPSVLRTQHKPRAIFCHLSQPSGGSHQPCAYPNQSTIMYYPAKLRRVGGTPFISFFSDSISVAWTVFTAFGFWFIMGRTTCLCSSRRIWSDISWGSFHIRRRDSISSTFRFVLVDRSLTCGYRGSKGRL